MFEKLETAKTRHYKFYKRPIDKWNSIPFKSFLELIVILFVTIRTLGYLYVVTADPLYPYNNEMSKPGFSWNHNNINYSSHSRLERGVDSPSLDHVSSNVEPLQKNGNSINMVAAAVESDEEEEESKSKTKDEDSIEDAAEDKKPKKTKKTKKTTKTKKAKKVKKAKGDDSSSKKKKSNQEVDEDEETPIDQFEDEEDFRTINVEKDYKGPTYEGQKITEEFVHAVIDHYKQKKKLHKKYVLKVIRKVKYYYQRQPTLIDLRVPRGNNVTIVGDIHGQLFDLLHIFEFNGYPSKTNRYLFNGDFVDRGRYSLECVVIIFGFKLLFPNRVYLNRGNHETKMMNHYFGFADEVKFKYSEKMLGVFTEVFQWLPLAHRINARVLILHGGLFREDGVTLGDIKHIERECEPKPNTLMFDMLWSDPKDGEGRSPNMMRGAGIEFGTDVTRAFCIRNKLDFIIRSHYPAKEGYAVQHNGRLVTVFSAPNYYGGNKGAIVKLESLDLIPEYITFTQTPEPSWDMETIVEGKKSVMSS